MHCQLLPARTVAPIRRLCVTALRALGTLIIVALATACGGGQEGGGMQMPPVPVSVAQVVSRS